jgi:hypothetical protein
MYRMPHSIRREAESGKERDGKPRRRACRVLREPFNRRGILSTNGEAGGSGARKRRPQATNGTNGIHSMAQIERGAGGAHAYGGAVDAIEIYGMAGTGAGGYYI